MHATYILSLLSSKHELQSISIHHSRIRKPDGHRCHREAFLAYTTLTTLTFVVQPRHNPPPYIYIYRRKHSICATYTHRLKNISNYPQLQSDSDFVGTSMPRKTVSCVFAYFRRGCFLSLLLQALLSSISCTIFIKMTYCNG
jgi:hypothetical protein